MTIFVVVFVFFVVIVRGCSKREDDAALLARIDDRSLQPHDIIYNQNDDICRS